MNSYFTIMFYEVEGSEKMLTFCIVAIFRKIQNGMIEKRCIYF